MLMRNIFKFLNSLAVKFRCLYKRVGFVKVISLNPEIQYFTVTELYSQSAILSL